MFYICTRKKENNLNRAQDKPFGIYAIAKVKDCKYTAFSPILAQMVLKIKKD